MKKVEDIMSVNPVTVQEDTPLTEAAVLLGEGGYNALPVVDKSGKLVGLFSEHSMISDKSYMHLKTLLKLISQLDFYKKDNAPIKEDLRQILALKVRDVMSSQPMVINASSSIEQAAALFADPKNNPLPVVDAEKKLVGILSVSDLTKFYGVSTRSILGHKDVDKQIDQFVKKFDKEFMVVTRFRVSTWFVASILFSFIGFAIAMFLIVRISV